MQVIDRVIHGRAKRCCPVCDVKGNRSVLKKRNLTYRCSRCGATFHSKGLYSLPVMIGDWSDTISKNFPKMQDCQDLSRISNFKIQRIYQEAYSTALLGFYNASLVLQGIMMEALVKEIIFIHLNQDIERDFGSSIRLAKGKKLITDDEFAVLDSVRENLRDPYLHSNHKKIVGKYGVQIGFVPTSEQPSDEETLYNLSKGDTFISTLDSKSGGERAQFIKEILDEKQCIESLKCAYEFTVKMCNSHLSEEAYKAHEVKFGPIINWTKDERKVIVKK